MVMLPDVKRWAAFRAARDRIGLTQVAIAQALNVEQAAVSKWETGRALPGAETLLRLAVLLECSVDALVGGIDTKYDELRRQLDSDQELHDLTSPVRSTGVSSTNPNRTVSGGDRATSTSRRPSGHEWTVDEMLARTEIIEHAERIIQLSTALNPAAGEPRTSGREAAGGDRRHPDVRHAGAGRKRGPHR